jgi:hypothetical protein
MSARWAAALGGAASFVVAEIAGVVGNQLGKSTSWAWAAFSVALVLGAAVTGWTAYRSARSGGAVCPGSARGRRVLDGGNVIVSKVSAEGGQAVGINYGNMSQIQRREGS